MKQKKYWTSEADLRQDPEYQKQQLKEFETDPIEDLLKENGSKPSRRDFLKVMGFSLSASAVLAACTKTPVKYALPYTNKPVDVTPGVANYYASTFFDGSEYSSILVKVREGRPIFIEGNPDSSITQGGLGARGNAAVLDLYDNFRLEKPMVDGNAANYDEATKKLGAILKNANGIRLVTGSILSPSTLQLIGEFADEYKGFQHVTYDADSASGIIVAHGEAFGRKALPRFRFDKAQMIVGINADFLGTWLSPVEYTKQYVANRTPSKGSVKMSRHVQLESTFTLTGAKADQRIPVKTSMEGAHVLALYNAVAAKAGQATFDGGKELPAKYENKLADELWASRGQALVVCGSNDANVQRLVIGINQMLGSYGTTIDNNADSLLRQGVEADFAQLIKDMESGSVDAVLFYDCNPVYNYANSAKLEAALKKVKTRVALVVSENETSKACNYLLPAAHWLESWGDAMPYKGFYSLQQPTIQNMYKGRQLQDLLLAWMGSDKSYRDYLQTYWKSQVFKTQNEIGSADKFWVAALEKGVYELGKPLTNGQAVVQEEKEEKKEETQDAAVVAAPVATPKAEEKKEAQAEAPAGLREVAEKVAADYRGQSGNIDLVLYQKVSIGTGVLANVPWLQEMPDPLTRATWDNYVLVSPKMAKDKGLESGDVVKVSAGNYSVTLPVLVQFGQQNETIAIAVGYGRTVVGKGGYKIGQNAWSAFMVKGDSRLNFRAGATLSKTDETYPLALSQTSLTAMERPIIRETTLKEFAEYTDELQKDRNILKSHLVNLYPTHDRPGHNWGMAVDLNKCTGCGACVIACQAENNIPVVGKEEVMRRRNLHWIRIDRYYGVQEGAESNAEKEVPGENPDVVFQPMMCQHCDNAPCENVCPVLATVHSSEGLNQQAYNRCFGTRYCANNCPYKVRRFNWLDYTNPENFQYNPIDNLGRMVLNPDVTVRARGVMEKCSFCVQRLQAGKLAAKMGERKLTDADVQTACAKSCPAGAIIFGDLNDKESAISKYYEDERTYFALEELKVLPSVAYKVVVRNRDEEKTAKA